MPANERRQWVGSCKHVVGEVKYVTRVSGVRLRALMVYETSLLELPAELPPLRMKLIGDALEIKCTICGAVRDWYLGEDAINELLANRKKRQKGI